MKCQVRFTASRVSSVTVLLLCLPKDKMVPGCVKQRRSSSVFLTPNAQVHGIGYTCVVRSSCIGNMFHYCVQERWLLGTLMRTRILRRTVRAFHGGRGRGLWKPLMVLLHRVHVCRKTFVLLELQATVAPALRWASCEGKRKSVKFWILRFQTPELCEIETAVLFSGCQPCFSCKGWGVAPRYCRIFIVSECLF